MSADINKYAEDAAAQEQPRWKGVLKILLMIAVIVVVALVAGPAVIGAVGAMAGALGASAAAAGVIGAVVGGAIVGAAAGAVTQMGNNLIDGKNLMEGVGQAMIVGAIGGALGGAGGALGQALGNAGKLGAGMTQTMMKFGIETGFDTVGNILGDLVSGNPITFESVMTSTLQGIGMSLAMSGAGKIKAVEATQTKFSDIGANFGTSVGSKIKTGFSGGIDTPHVNTPHVNTPNVKQPETEVKAPATEVKAPETEVKAPATEVKTPETEVKAPATEVKALETEVKAPATEVKALETEVKAPTNNEPDTPNKRATHTDEPEVEPGIVAKEPTADGHEIKVLKDGRIVKCSECGEIRQKYAEQLKQNPELKNRLDEIENLDLKEKARQAWEFEQNLRLQLGEIRIIRQDNDFSSGTNHKNNAKSYRTDQGSLCPANPQGSASPLQHIYGTEPAKSDSPHTSFLTEEGGVAKTYGSSEIELDVLKLQADIQSGKLNDVEILTPQQISELIKSDIKSVTDTNIDFDAAIGNRPQGIDQYVNSLGLSNSKSAKLSRKLLAYYNTTRDGEYLIKGIIPSKYIK